MTHFEISDDELSTEILHEEIDRLRADKDSALNIATQALARAERAEAAIARVCAVLDEPGLNAWLDGYDLVRRLSKIRAAIEGEL